MKVGTDGVLLGAWAPIIENTSNNILDIGTGTALISLMLAQRNPLSNIDAIEIDDDAAQQAQENINHSQFHNINVFHTSLQNHNPPHLYKHIVCNPPFFIDSLKSPNSQRNTARHTDSLTFEQLIQHSNRLLEENGTLSVIIPHNSSEHFITTCLSNNLQLSLFTHVYSTINSTSPKRALLHFIKSSSFLTPQHTNLTIELSRHNYSPEYINLTQAFYLNM